MKWVKKGAWRIDLDSVVAAHFDESVSTAILYLSGVGSVRLTVAPADFPGLVTGLDAILETETMSVGPDEEGLTVEFVPFAAAPVAAVPVAQESTVTWVPEAPRTKRHGTS